MLPSECGRSRSSEGRMPVASLRVPPQQHLNNRADMSAWERAHLHAKRDLELLVFQRVPLLGPRNINLSVL